MSWKKYLVSVLAFSGFGLLVLFLLQVFQKFLPFNPQHIEGMSWDLSLNTAISFVTNTNWQAYSGESQLSYLSQALGLTVQNFVTPATGIAVLYALIRGFTRVKGKGVGNFWTDLTRSTLYVLMPLSLAGALMIASQGVPQTWKAAETVELMEPVAFDADGNYLEDARINGDTVTVDGEVVEDAEVVTEEIVPLGFAASQIAIKQLGTNGGGYYGVNSAHPLENPNWFSNLLEMLFLLLIPASLCFSFGRDVKDKKQGIAVFMAMFLMLIAAMSVVAVNEQSASTVLTENEYVDTSTDGQAGGNMEGKETRFGIAQSALFTTVTTSFTTGTVNNMHDSLTPLGGLVPMLHMMLNCVFGGKGVGLMNMVMYVILAVFICGLMVGRTPEYLNKKIEGREMKLVALVILIHPLLILGFSALGVATQTGTSGITNPGYHGLSQILYEFASSAANNGSGFEGLADNSVFWNITTGLAMFFGRYFSIVAQLAVAGSLLAKKKVNESIGSLKTDNVTFMIILVFIVYIFAALTFFPALALGPVAEHLSLWQ